MPANAAYRAEVMACRGRARPVSSARRRWFDVLCRDVLRLAGTSVGVVRAYAPVRHRPDLGAAAVVAWICRSASVVMTTDQIVDHLMVSEALEGYGPGDVTSLVRQVRVEWGCAGLPIADWWSPDQLLGAFLCYLAPRLVLERGADVARWHLRTVFGLTDERVITALIVEPCDPIPLPASPVQIEADGGNERPVGLELLVYLADRPEVRRYSAEARRRSLLGDDGPARSGRWQWDDRDQGVDAWLVEGQASFVMWRTLDQLTRAWVAEGVDDDHFGGGRAQRDEARLIAAEGWRRCQLWLADLTEPEQILMAEQDQRVMRRRRWLDAHLRIFRAPYQMPDSVPDRMVAGERSAVPDWVAAEVFDHGARIIRHGVGSIEHWGVVVETDEEEEDAEADLACGTSGKLAVWSTPTGVTFHLAVGQGEWRTAMLAPFYFQLDEPHGAVGLLLACLAGVRLDYYRLRGERELVHLGGRFIRLPADTTAGLLDRVDETLTLAEDREPGVSLLILLSRAPDPAPYMFVGADNAKSEEILFDLGLSGSSGEEKARAVSAARASLAAAHANRVSAEADSQADPTVSSAVENARNIYRRRRQEAQLRFRGGDTPADLTVGVVEPGRAFVQLAEFDDSLACVIVVDEGEGSRVRLVNLGHVRVDRLRSICDYWLAQTSERSWEKRAAVLDTVLDWVGHELVSPIVETLRGSQIHHLVLSPSRSLEPIPIHACHVGTDLLADLYQISYAPSAAVVRDLAARRADPLDLDLVVAASGAHAPPGLGLDVLEGPDQEASALTVLAPGARVLGGAAAGPDAVLAAIAGSHVAHASAHGWSRPDALASGLWLAGDTPGHALLSAARVHAGPPLTKTSLIVLSACETGRHPVGGRAIQTWRGLDSAFLARGARAVVSSLWEIDDVIALVYSVAFHTRLASGRNIVDAHIAAVTALRNGSHDSRAARILDQVCPLWRIELAALESNRAYGWSAYRLSGACW